MTRANRKSSLHRVYVLPGLSTAECLAFATTCGVTHRRRHSATKPAVS